MPAQIVTKIAIRAAQIFRPQTMPVAMRPSARANTVAVEAPSPCAMAIGRKAANASISNIAFCACETPLFLGIV